MKLFYITVNNQTEAETISYALLEKQLAVCVNWFPITCAYRWQGQIKQDSEVVLIVKTQDAMKDTIEHVVNQQIDYTNFIAEIDVHSVNNKFLNWLKTEVPVI